jgi:histidyl-tRNA synthetase
MKKIIQTVKGVREFYPEQYEIRNWLYSIIKEVSTSFGYQEYDGPFLEKIDLYAAKSGEELVKEQAFVFPDRSGELITLRPELTPSLARMVAQRQNELVFPLRWWSFGPFWRYERPQKGRTREFFQWNIDLIGANSPLADSELIVICAKFLQKIGIKPDQIKILVNHRILIETELQKLGILQEQKKVVFQLIDRIDKLPQDSWEKLAIDKGVSEFQLQGIKTILDNKDLWKESLELTKVFDMLDFMGVRDYVQFDPRIIRGLDYYTGIVFEAWDMGGEGRAVLGGGHYDNLVGDIGGESLPGVGFAMGDVMINLMLEKYDCIPKFNGYGKMVLVTTFDESCTQASIKFSKLLRENNINVVTYPEVSKLQKQLKFADRLGFRVVIVIGPDEVADNTITIKDLLNSTQVSIPARDAVSEVQRILAQGNRV